MQALALAYMCDGDAEGMSGQTVLVIDDDPDIRELIAQTLSDEGYHVATSGDGAEAVTEAKKNPPGLILLDLMMPKLSGWEVMELLRGQPETTKIPVVLVSASRDIEMAMRDLQANGSLTKPFDLDALLNLVHAYLGPPSGVRVA